MQPTIVWFRGQQLAGIQKAGTHLFYAEVYEKPGVTRNHAIHDSLLAFFVSDIIAPGR